MLREKAIINKTGGQDDGQFSHRNEVANDRYLKYILKCTPAANQVQLENQDG